MDLDADEFTFGESGKYWIKYTVRLEGMETANDGETRCLIPAFIFIGKDEKGFFLWVPVPWTHDGVFLPSSLMGEGVFFRKAMAEPQPVEPLMHGMDLHGIER